MIAHWLAWWCILSNDLDIEWYSKFMEAKRFGVEIYETNEAGPIVYAIAPINDNDCYWIWAFTTRCAAENFCRTEGLRIVEDQQS